MSISSDDYDNYSLEEIREPYPLHVWDVIEYNAPHPIPYWEERRRTATILSINPNNKYSDILDTTKNECIPNDHYIKKISERVNDVDVPFPGISMPLQWHILSREMNHEGLTGQMYLRQRVHGAFGNARKIIARKSAQRGISPLPIDMQPFGLPSQHASALDEQERDMSKVEMSNLEADLVANKNEDALSDDSSVDSVIQKLNQPQKSTLTIAQLRAQCDDIFGEQRTAKDNDNHDLLRTTEVVIEGVENMQEDIIPTQYNDNMSKSDLSSDALSRMLGLSSSNSSQTIAIDVSTMNSRSVRCDDRSVCNVPKSISATTSKTMNNDCDYSLSGRDIVCDNNKDIKEGDPNCDSISVPKSIFESTSNNITRSGIEIDDDDSNDSKDGDHNCAINLASMSTEEIQEMFRMKVTTAMTQPWRGSVPFHCYIHSDIDPKKDVEQQLSTDELQYIDICDFLNGQKYPVTKLYFCPVKYPRDTSVVLSQPCSSWTILRIDLEKAGLSAGNEIYSNGGGKGRRQIRCIGAGRQRSSADGTIGESTECSVSIYRNTSLINNDKGNRRGKKGRSLRRKSQDAGNASLNALLSQEHPEGNCPTCQFGFTVMWNHHGYYVSLQNRSGRPCHNSHAPIKDTDAIPFPSRFLSSGTIDELRNVVCSTQSFAAARNYVLCSTDKFMDSMNVAYIMNREKDDKLLDDVAAIIASFKESKDIAFTAMSDIPVTDLLQLSSMESSNRTLHITESETVTISTTKNNNGEFLVEKATADNGLLEIASIAQATRKNRKLDASQYLFLSIAWVYLPTYRFFTLCPEVIWCDVTSHSNKRGYKLLTFSCRTSIDKQVVFMFIWIPNEQRVSFKWVFQHAVPRIIPMWLRNRVKLASEGGCGWHIVSQGWRAHIIGVKSISVTNRDMWENVVKKVQNWVYSWMKPGNVEDEEEYKISKYLLLRFVCSEMVFRAADSDKRVILTVVRFLQNNVFVHESTYLHYLRKNVRHFDTSTSSAHEGTNLGLKSNAAAMRATMSLDKSADALITQSRIIARKLEKLIVRDVKKRNKKWSHLPTSPWTTSFGEGLIKSVWDRRHLYECKRIGSKLFEIHYNGKEPSSEYGECAMWQIPKFSRIRLVSIDDYGVMTCTCCRFESRGIFCKHQVVTAEAVHNANGMRFNGFTHNDIAPRYLCDYMHYAYKPTTDDDMLKIFDQLAFNDLSGPTLHIRVPSSMKIHEPSAVYSALDRLTNYKNVNIDLSIIDGFYATDHIPDGACISGVGSDNICNEIFERIQKIKERDVTTHALSEKSSLGCIHHEEKKQVIRSSAKEECKSLVHTCYSIIDIVGPEAKDDFEGGLKDFLSRWEKKMYEGNKEKGLKNCSGVDTQNTRSYSKRKYVHLPLDEYTGTADRIYNTRLMH